MELGIHPRSATGKIAIALYPRFCSVRAPSPVTGKQAFQGTFWGAFKVLLRCPYRAPNPQNLPIRAMLL